MRPFFSLGILDYVSLAYIHLGDSTMDKPSRPIELLEVATTSLDLTDANTLLSLDLISNFDEETILTIIKEAKKQTGQGWIAYFSIKTFKASFFSP